MQQTSAHIEELERRPSPAARCQALALSEGLLWTASWETKHIYGLDPKTWNVVEDVPAPGTPYGIAALGGALHVVVSDDGEADDRYIYRFVPRQGFVTDSKAPCPELTGSHLISDGTRLYLGQAHEGRIVALDDAYRTAQAFPLPTRAAGFGFGPDGKLFMISADDEFDNLVFGTLNLNAEPASFSPIAPIDPNSRSLAYDGSAWFTSLREAGEIVKFRVR